MKPTFNSDDEVWKPLASYEGYEVSTHGRIRSLSRTITKSRNGGPEFQYPVAGRMLTPWIQADGYPSVKLLGESRLVHTLVIETFVGPRPENMVTRHLDGNPSNNHLSNLMWGTPSENNHDKVRHGTDHNTCKTHCPHGHEYTTENTYVCGHRRECRACKVAACRRYRAKKRRMGEAYVQF